MNKFSAWPRVRGKTGKVEDPPEYAGKWAWTIWVIIQATGKPDTPVREIHSHELDPERFFDTEGAAKLDLEKEATQVCKLLNEALGGTGDEGFLDMKDDMKHKTTFEAAQ